MILEAIHRGHGGRLARADDDAGCATAVVSAALAGVGHVVGVGAP